MGAPLVCWICKLAMLRTCVFGHYFRNQQWGLESMSAMFGLSKMRETHAELDGDTPEARRGHEMMEKNREQSHINLLQHNYRGTPTPLINDCLQWGEFLRTDPDTLRAGKSQAPTLDRGLPPDVRMTCSGD
jgi:hypothetical protein